MKKKALALVLVLCMALSMLPVTAFAAQPKPAPQTGTMMVPRTVGELETASVSPNASSYSVTLTSSGRGEAELLVSSPAKVGSEVYFVANPDDGYLAEIYYEGLSSDALVYVGADVVGFIMPANKVKLEVRFVAAQGEEHHIAVFDNGNGEYALSRGYAKEYESVLLAIKPDNNAAFKPMEYVWCPDATMFYLFEEQGVHYFEIIMGDKPALVFFCYKYSSNPIQSVVHGGFATITTNVQYAGVNDLVTATIIPDPGYRLIRAEAHSSMGHLITELTPIGNNQYTFRVHPSTTDIHVWVEPILNNVTVKAGPGGTARANVTQAKIGDTVTVTCTPDQNYRVYSVTGVQGIQDKGGNVYTFTMPGNAVTVNVNFRKIYNPVNLTVETGLGGSAITNVTEAKMGDTVTLTCTPDEGYRIARIAGVKNLVDNGDGTYTFTMPDEAVELKVLFLRHENPFLDVNETQFFYTPVLWAVEENITAGLAADSFGPFAVCNRAQVVTFLWRAAGCPEPTGTENPFTDVAAGSFYERAVLWAVENGITAGLTADTFGPNAPCNRAQVVTFLYRARNARLPEGAQNPFEDVEEKDFYYAPVLWALENGVTAGSDATHFNPNGQCQRAQVVTFLYRAKDLPDNTIGELNIKTAPGTAIYVGESLQIEYTYTGDKSALTWKSNDTSILTVNNSGKVTGVGVGETRVAVYHGDTMVGRIRLVVEEKVVETEPPEMPKAERISASEFTGPYFDGTAGVVGNYMTFRATAKTSGDNQAVTATSSNSGVVSVERTSVTGSNSCLFKVKFKGAGTATITITSEDGNASKSYTITVKGSYSSAKSGALSPEEFVSCVNGIMTENGANISTSMGYRVLTLSEDELTGSKARSKAEGWVREFWPNGIRSMGLAYQGVNEDGNHVFYIHC